MAATMHNFLARCLAALAVSGMAAPSCLVYSEPDYVTTYEPLYYNGYVVYYDAYGVPFYYVGGVLYDVPRSYVHYDVLVEHYRRHAHAYHQWYFREGSRAPRESRAPRPPSQPSRFHRTHR